MEKLLSLDRSIFFAINGWNSPIVDPIMFFISGKFSWIPLYIFFLYLIFHNYEKKGWLILALVTLTILMSDMGSVYLFKDTFQRLRPSHEPLMEGLVHLVNGDRGGQYGFVSSHAANNFALVLFLIQFLGKKYKWLPPVLLFWATLIIYSRVYLGVHYPGDILCGAIYGSLVGFIVAKMGMKLLKIERVE